jgi:hypothetical protein
VAPADGARAAFHRLAFRRGAIACLGFIGDRTFRAAVVRLARRLDASRVAPLGRMQAPPLSWRQDGARPVLDLIAPEAPASSRAAGISGDHPW